MLFDIRPLDGAVEQNTKYIFFKKKKKWENFFFHAPVICLLTLLSDVYLLACPLENLFLSFLFDATAESLITRHPCSTDYLLEMHSTAPSQGTRWEQDDEPLITPKNIYKFYVFLILNRKRPSAAEMSGGTHHPIPEFRDADHFWGSGLNQVINGSHEIIRPKPRRWASFSLL